MQQLPTVSVHLSSVNTLSSAKLQSVDNPSSAQLDGSYNTECTKPVLLKRTPVQLSGTSGAHVRADGCVNALEGDNKQGVPDHLEGAGGGEVLQEGGGHGDKGEGRGDGGRWQCSRGHS